MTSFLLPMGCRYTWVAVGVYGRAKLYIPLYLSVSLLFGFLSITFGFDCVSVRIQWVSSTNLTLIAHINISNFQYTL